MRKILVSAFVLLLAMPALARRSPFHGNFPQRTPVSVAPLAAGLDVHREVPVGDWLSLNGLPFYTRTPDQLAAMLAATENVISFDGVSEVAAAIVRTQHFDYCDPTQPGCTFGCPNGDVFPVCDQPAGCDFPIAFFIWRFPPASAGWHVGTWSTTQTQSFTDGWCTYAPHDLDYVDEREILATPRGSFPATSYPTDF
jgi:hypothetical protein